MTMKKSLGSLELLRPRPEKKYTAREIAAWIIETYPEECRAKQERSAATAYPLKSKKHLRGQIASEIGAARPSIQKRNTAIKTTEGRPRKYYYTESSDIEEIRLAESAPSKASASGGATRKENDLYPELSGFLLSEPGVRSKRIDKKRSRNSRGKGCNKWLQPDLVEMQDLNEDGDREVKDCVKQYSDKRTNLWSFEVKIMINVSNVRNCSWANFSCLVAGKISKTDTMKKLQMLASLHGIGLIRLMLKMPR